MDKNIKNKILKEALLHLLREKGEEGAEENEGVVVELHEERYIVCKHDGKIVIGTSSGTATNVDVDFNDMKEGSIVWVNRESFL